MKKQLKSQNWRCSLCFGAFMNHVINIYGFLEPPVPLVIFKIPPSPTHHHVYLSTCKKINARDILLDNPLTCDFYDFVSNIYPLLRY